MRASYHPDYYVELPAGHPFPMRKYPELLELLLGRRVLDRRDLITPTPAALETLALVHTRRYLARLAGGTLAAEEIRRLGVPWSAALWRRSRLAVQGTINAAVIAQEDGCCGNLAGGTHHAFADRGEGFCVLNDVAVAIRWLQQEGRLRRALVIDLDVHQGNGTAAIFHGDDSVFTFSMHGERNYPARKMRSSLDVGLADGLDDGAYLTELGRYLPVVIERARADVVFYLAGVDPVRGDRYGRLLLSDDGLRHRERMVLEALHQAALPVVITLAGGYAADARRTAELHAVVFEEAVRLHQGSAATRAALAGTDGDTVRVIES